MTAKTSWTLHVHCCALQWLLFFFFSTEIEDVKPVSINTSMFSSFLKIVFSSSALFTSLTYRQDKGKYLQLHFLK